MNQRNDEEHTFLLVVVLLFIIAFGVGCLALFVQYPVETAPAPPDVAELVTQPAAVEPEALDPPPVIITTHEPAPVSLPATSPPPSEKPAPPPPKNPSHHGTIILVIDDAGNSLRDLEPFLQFPGPLTIAVLPGLPNSAETARRIRAAGKDVFLHQPMEAIGGQDPGPGAVYGGMTSEEVRRIIEQNLAELWPVAGMNNHQGSKTSQDKAIMETVLTVCREQRITFLDSRTIGNTVVPTVAQSMGMHIAERDIFLDNSQEKASILSYLDEGLRKAERTGAAIMIGHTWSKGLAAILTEQHPILIKEGYKFSTVPKN